tara:strand:+ start:11441 stop:13078 length:1638 start_codon:yes stop_codon:yes gene_type:complete
MHQLNASIEAVVRPGLFVPMSKCARMLVLFLGLFLFMNSQINLISSQEIFDLDKDKIQKNSTSSRSTPVITDFSVSSPELGDGTSPSSRAWFSLDETDSILFEWSATDENIDFASLSNAPGETPSPDVSPFNYEWEINGGLDEGIYNPSLTVQDLDSNVATSTLYIGIDRTGPTVGSPSLTYDNNGVITTISPDDWISTNEINVSNLNVGVTDNGGVGADSYEYQILPNGNGWQSISSSGSSAISVNSGELILQFRAVDLLGNQGNSVNFSFNVDNLNPNFHGWEIPEITTSTVQNIEISFMTSDVDSGIDSTNTIIEYGFDLDGSGDSPDDGNGWTTLPTSADESNTFSAILSGIIWELKENQYLMLRATIMDNAGNQKVTDPMLVTILPGIDISWDSTQLDRLIIRTGSGQVFTLSSTIISNEPFMDSFDATLQIAPADRDSTVEWTTISTETIPIGSMTDLVHEIEWTFSLTSGGQWDVRVLVDSGNSIDERDEGNNDRYLIVSGADGEQVVGIVPGFMPSLFSLMIVGFLISGIINRKNRN